MGTFFPQKSDHKASGTVCYKNSDYNVTGKLCCRDVMTVKKQQLKDVSYRDIIHRGRSDHIKNIRAK
jgi:hypothetical protein